MSPQNANTHTDQGGNGIVAVCGGINWDMITRTHRIPDGGETYNSKSFDMFPGGKGANTAIALYRLSHIRPHTQQLPENQLDDKVTVPKDEDTAKGNSNRCVEPRTTVRPQNAYSHLNLPDIEVRMIGSVGSDEFGIKMIESLGQNFVNVDNVQRQAGIKSAVATIIVESQAGQHRILVYSGANHCPKPEDFSDVKCFGDQRPELVVSQLEFERDTVERLVKTAKEAGAETLLNPSPAHHLPDAIYDGLTHLVLSESEAAILTEREVHELKNGFTNWDEITDEFLELGVQHVVVTRGSKGAFFSNQKGRGEFVSGVNIDQNDILDSSGAADTFVGAYAIQRLKQKRTGKWDMRSAVEYANKAAARVIQKIGCQEAIPWASDLDPTMSTEDPDGSKVQESPQRF